MGSSSSFLRNIPSDYSKCSNEQLESVISSAIVRQPWYERDEAIEIFAKMKGLGDREMRIELESIDHIMKNIVPFDLQCSAVEKARNLTEFLLLSTVEEMRIRGYRPISANEYRNHLLRMRDFRGRGKCPPIKLWRKIHESSSAAVMSNAPLDECKRSNVVFDEEEGHYIRLEEADHKETGLQIVLPSSKDDLTDEYVQMAEEIKSNVSAGVLKTQFVNHADHTLSQCETEEWPSAYSRK